MNIDQELLIAEFLRPSKDNCGPRGLHERTRAFLEDRAYCSRYAPEFERVIRLLDALYEFAKETKGTP